MRLHPWRTLCLVSLSVAALLGLAGCAIEETDSAERRISEDELYDLRLEGVSPLQTAFMQDCLKCIMGDYSKLDELTAKFTASQRDPNFPEPYVLQAYEPNILFEACAQKALHDGRPELFKATVTRAGRAARIAQHFYAAGNAADGGFWLQRVINLQGEAQGLTTAGRIFAGNIDTLASGAKMLEQAARLGSREAAQILISLTNPSSSYYHNIQTQLQARSQE